MAQSLSHLIVHAVFSTKDRRALLRSEEIRSETYSYVAGIWKNLQCHPIKIGGADDHVHILSSLSKNIAFADFALRATQNVQTCRPEGPARHEVPGVMRKIASPSGTIERISV